MVLDKVGAGGWECCDLLLAMKVLLGCEESQAVCIEFRKLGHEA